MSCGKSVMLAESGGWLSLMILSALEFLSILASRGWLFSDWTREMALVKSVIWSSGF